MIKTVKIKNFKSIIEETVKLPDFGAVVGLNGAGKSNLIQAIDVVRSLILGADIETVQMKMSTIPNELFNLKDKNSSKPFSIEVELENVNQEIFSFKIGISKNQNQKQELSLIVSEEIFCKKIENKFEKIYSRDEKGSIYQNNGELMPFVMPEDKLFATVYDHEDLEACRELFKETRIHHFDGASLRTPRFVIVGGARIDQLSRLISKIMKNESLYKDFIKILKGLMPNFSDFKEINFEGEKIKGEPRRELLLLLQEESLQSDLTTRAMSEGDARTLFIVATALDMARDSTLIIEELENGMHPERISKLFDHLDTFSKVKNMQVVFTTHSPIVINKLGAERVLFVEKDGDGSHFTLLRESEDISKIKDLLKDGGRLSDYLSRKI